MESKIVIAIFLFSIAKQPLILKKFLFTKAVRFYRGGGKRRDFRGKDLRARPNLRWRCSSYVRFSSLFWMIS